MQLDADYWNNRYLNNDSPWDIGYASPAITEYFDKVANKNASILIPGAGNAFEAEYLFRKGFNYVFVLDFSEKAIKNFITRVPDFPTENLIQADFFSHFGNYDYIIEQTFFCAIDPCLRNKYVKKVSELLNDDGRLVGLLFNDAELKGNPPFGGTIEEYNLLFENEFELDINLCNNSISPRSGRELFVNLLKKTY
ncbi:MAG: SAM-dependent methyltransferase [Bacteroidota bacterium]|jgi:SAM-dependent methyltransferase